MRFSMKYIPKRSVNTCTEEDRITENIMDSKDKEDLNLFDLACAKISQAQQLMSEARELLKQDLDNVRQEKSAFQELTKTLNQVHFSSTVKLNVGGKIYKTTLDTLRKDSDSMLCAMFSGRHELKPDEEDGSFFIDRDGKLFRYILNYLRDGDLLCPDDTRVQKELLKEARFYQIQGIIALLDRTSFLSESAIIQSASHISAVQSWLGPGVSSSLLFRATTDGKTPADFHRCCDGKGATLVVVKSENYVFGGYTSKSWSSPSSNNAIADGQAFLFTLVNQSGSKPVKIGLTPGASGGIHCNQAIGPAFGTKGSYDLVIWDRGNSYHFLRFGFICPQNEKGNTYFTGKRPLPVDELEVFKIQI